MDDCDLGSKHDDFFRRQALAKHLNRQSSGRSMVECSECGEGIPEARRKAVPGCVRCVKCETKFERRS
ncbi:MAG: TraR/DksA family transcriptional regulator [Desulfobacteraceae bacterium]|nr:TraR/DksA family transcriptional regulator [Desulfobacteraceae bacterium]